MVVSWNVRSYLDVLCLEASELRWADYLIVAHCSLPVEEFSDPALEFDHQDHLVSVEVLVVQGL